MLLRKADTGKHFSRQSFIGPERGLAPVVQGFLLLHEEDRERVGAEFLFVGVVDVVVDFTFAEFHDLVDADDILRLEEEPFGDVDFGFFGHVVCLLS